MHKHHTNSGGACAPTDQDPIEADEFIDGYLQAAAFLGVADGTGSPVSVDQLPEDFVAQARKDCLAFLADNLAIVREHCDQTGGWRGPTDSCGNDRYSATECAGHDFYYSRNGHGTGFLDRDTGAIGERLTASANAFGEHIPLGAAD